MFLNLFPLSPPAPRSRLRHFSLITPPVKFSYHRFSNTVCPFMCYMYICALHVNGLRTSFYPVRTHVLDTFICPSRSLPALLHPSLCPEKLTSMDCIKGPPCPLASGWVWSIGNTSRRWEAGQKVRQGHRLAVAVVVGAPPQPRRSRSQGASSGSGFPQLLALTAAPSPVGVPCPFPRLYKQPLPS